MSLRIVIVEDEPVTARTLRNAIADAEPAAQIVAMHQSVADAVAWFREHPSGHDLIFMDIRLGDGMSFDIFSQVKIESPVIFVTAYNEYALRAFKANGIDYLLKPIDDEELRAALRRYHKLVGTRVPDNAMSMLQQVLSGIGQGAGAYRKSFLVRFRDKFIPLSVTSVAWFYTAHEIVYAYTTDGQMYTIDMTMEQLEAGLSPDTFFRASRQFVLSRTAINEVQHHFNGRLVAMVTPAPPEPVIISKARAPMFRQWLDS